MLALCIIYFSQVQCVWMQFETIEYAIWMCVSVFVWFLSVTVTTWYATELLRDDRKAVCSNGNFESYGFYLFRFVLSWLILSCCVVMRYIGTVSMWLWQNGREMVTAKWKGMATTKWEEIATAKWGEMARAKWEEMAIGKWEGTETVMGEWEKTGIGKWKVTLPLSSNRVRNETLGIPASRTVNEWASQHIHGI